MIVEAGVVVGSLALAYKYYTSIVASVKAEAVKFESELKAELEGVEARIVARIVYAVKAALTKV